MGTGESAREVCDSEQIGGGKPKSMWWNDQVKGMVKRKEDVWREVLEARDEDAREMYLEVYKEKKRKVKRCNYQSKEKVQEQFGRKMNQDVNGIGSRLK